MLDKRNTQRKQGIEGYIQELKDTGKIVAIRGKSTQKAAETIKNSLSMPGTKGEAHKDMLLAKIDNLERLTVLHTSISSRLLSAAEKLANGTPEDEITADMIVYNKFLTDQLKCEEEENQHILDILQDNGHHNSNCQN